MSASEDIFASALDLEETHQEEGFQQGQECACARSSPSKPCPSPLSNDTRGSVLPQHPACVITAHTHVQTMLVVAADTARTGSSAEDAVWAGRQQACSLTTAHSQGRAGGRAAGGARARRAEGLRDRAGGRLLRRCAGLPLRTRVRVFGLRPESSFQQHPGMLQAHDEQPIAEAGLRVACVVAHRSRMSKLSVRTLLRPPRTSAQPRSQQCAPSCRCSSWLPHGVMIWPATLSDAPLGRLCGGVAAAACPAAGSGAAARTCGRRRHRAHAARFPAGQPSGEIFIQKLVIIIVS